jgi:CHAT domain-containing protein
LLIVADGALQYVPFPALLVSEKGGGLVPLIVEHELISLPSASTLIMLRREFSGRKPAPNLLAVLADPVFDLDDSRVKRPNKAGVRSAGPSSQRHEGKSTDLPTIREESTNQPAEGGWPRLLFTRMEADAIIKTARSRKIKKALGFEASKALATSPVLSSFRILHFATHGIINSVYPELSGIVLSLVDENGSPQDGFLRLHEVYNLKLTAELVVLSACQTGLGKEMFGEGLVGLTRGFMYAGVPRVVASLWNVKDEATAELMKRFYAAMFREGKTASAALQAAQASLWRDRDWQSSYYWAGFVIQGDWR